MTGLFSLGQERDREFMRMQEQVSMLPEAEKSKMAAANGPVLGGLLNGYPTKFNTYWEPVEYGVGGQGQGQGQGQS